MPTDQDTAFAARFPDITANVYVATNQTALANYTPTSSVLNTGMMADIGRATVYAPDLQDNFYARFMKSPLARGDSEMFARFKDVSSAAYNPLAADSALFDGQRPEMVSNVATKNFSRQIRLEINDRYLKQMAQSQEMIGDAQAAIMAASNACYRDDMWCASKEYFSGSTRGAGADQLHVLTNDVDDAGFADELNELIWEISQKQFGYKSTKYNKTGVNTKSDSVAIALLKDCEYPGFKKLYAETFHPDWLRIEQSIDYVDSFATTAGAPGTAGDLLGIVADTRAYAITPMPEPLTVEAFRNAARKSTMYATTYEYAFSEQPFFNKAYIFAPSS